MRCQNFDSKLLFSFRTISAQAQKSFRHPLPICLIWDLLTAMGYFRFILFLKTLEHLNVTTLLSSKIRTWPVWGFLPLLFFLSFMQNLPNLLIRTSSPLSRVALMISSSVSTIRADFLLVNPSLATFSIMSAFVSVMTSSVSTFTFLLVPQLYLSICFANS